MTMQPGGTSSHKRQLSLAKGAAGNYLVDSV